MGVRKTRLVASNTRSAIPPPRWPGAKPSHRTIAAPAGGASAAGVVLTLGDANPARKWCGGQQSWRRASAASEAGQLKAAQLGAYERLPEHATAWTPARSAGSRLETEPSSAGVASLVSSLK